MKKAFAFILSVTMMVSCFSGCGSSSSGNSMQPSSTTPSSSTASTSTSSTAETKTPELAKKLFIGILLETSP